MNPIIINEKNFNRFAKRLQKLITEKPQNQYAPGLMESQELLSQIFGVQSLHEMKKMLELIAESEKKFTTPVKQSAVNSENVFDTIPATQEFDLIPALNPFNPDSNVASKRFKASTLNVKEQTEILLEKMEKESIELEQWIENQKNFNKEYTLEKAWRSETVFSNELHYAYAVPHNGITLRRKAMMKYMFEKLDANNLNDKWQESGYILGCFLQAVQGDEIIDMSMPFDWIPVDNSQANWNDDIPDNNLRPLTSHDLKELIKNYQTYLEDSNLSQAQIEVCPFYKRVYKHTDEQVFKIVEMVSDKKKSLKIK